MGGLGSVLGEAVKQAPEKILLLRARCHLSGLCPSGLQRHRKQTSWEVGELSHYSSSKKYARGPRGQQETAGPLRSHEVMSSVPRRPEAGALEGLAEPGVPEEPQKARVAVTGWGRITRTTRRWTGPGHIDLRVPVRMWDQKVQSSPWASVECWMRTELVIYLLSTYCVPSMVIASSIECLLCTRYRYIASLEHLLSWCLHFS